MKCLLGIVCILYLFLVFCFRMCVIRHVLCVKYILQSCLCYCVELCLESITSLSNLIQFTPTEIDLSFSPLPKELLPPIITCKDFSVGEKAQKLLKVCTPFFFITCSVTSYFFINMQYYRRIPQIRPPFLHASLG